MTKIFRDYVTTFLCFRRAGLKRKQQDLRHLSDERQENKSCPQNDFHSQKKNEVE